MSSRGSNPDRTVHAEFPGLEEVVRYDRAGKWYIELPAAAARTAVARAASATVNAVRRFMKHEF